MGYDRIYYGIHELVLALRAIERTIESTDGHLAIKRMDVKAHDQLLQFARTGNVAAVRNLISEVLSRTDLTTLSYFNLRQRASRLRIPGFNKMDKAELIRNIQAVEEVIREKLNDLKPPEKGFTDGDGI